MSLNPLPKPQVLLIEDNPDHVEILRDKFSDSRIAELKHVFDSGEEGFRYLESQLASTAPDPRLPDVIMLDLNLPGEDGMQILHRIKTHPELKDIPVIIYTASLNKQNILSTYKLGGTFFMNKEWNADILNEAISHIGATRAKKPKGA